MTTRNNHEYDQFGWLRGGAGCWVSPPVEWLLCLLDRGTRPLVDGAALGTRPHE